MWVANTVELNKLELAANRRTLTTTKLLNKRLLKWVSLTYSGWSDSF